MSKSELKRLSEQVPEEEQSKAMLRRRIKSLEESLREMGDYAEKRIRALEEELEFYREGPHN